MTPQEKETQCIAKVWDEINLKKQNPSLSIVKRPPSNILTASFTNSMIGSDNHEC
jgi:hypothetical protein